MVDGHSQASLRSAQGSRGGRRSHLKRVQRSMRLEYYIDLPKGPDSRALPEDRGREGNPLVHKGLGPRTKPLLLRVRILRATNIYLQTGVVEKESRLVHLPYSLEYSGRRDERDEQRAPHSSRRW